MELSELTIEKARELLVTRQISSEELTRFALESIRKRDGEIHAFLEVNADLAIDAARRVDKKIAAGDTVPSIAGIPGAIKDNILIKGLHATAASKILENYVAPYDATAINNLKELGAVFLGKTNLDEFAMGSSTENSAFGPTKNPHDTSRVPGGSSGGSAAAVAAGECIWALGSDTGGSVRQPAGFCGVVGLKPTYGAVSRYGLIAMSSSLDQIGPLAKTVKDAAIVFEAIAGHDSMDSTSAPDIDYRGISNFENCLPSFGGKIKNLRIGFPHEYFSAGCGSPPKADAPREHAFGGGGGIDPDVERSVRNAIKKFEELGARIEEISLPHTPYALACYYIIQPAEVSANLARYDGIRYGARKNAEAHAEKRGNFQRESALSLRQSALEEQYFAARGEGFGKEVRRRILLGTYVLSAGYYEAYYAKAQKVRRLIKDDFLKAFEKVDLVVAPTSPTLPFKFGDRTQDPVSMYLADIYTVSINLAGLPALSMPCGRINSLPVGIQIIGKPFDEKVVLGAGSILEEALSGKR